MIVRRIRGKIIKVRTDSSTEFGSNPILIDMIRIESAAGSNPILIVQIRTALDRAVDFNERVTAFTTGRLFIHTNTNKNLYSAKFVDKTRQRRRVATSKMAMPTCS